jgi:hypothetical protein
MGLKVWFVDDIPPSERIAIEKFIAGMDTNSWVHEYAFRGGDVSHQPVFIGTRVLVKKGWHQIKDLDQDLYHFTAELQGVYRPPYVSTFW